MSEQRTFLLTILVHVSLFLLFCCGSWHSTPTKKEKLVVVTKEFKVAKPVITVAKPKATVVKATPVALKKTPPPLPKKVEKAKPVATKKKKAPAPSKQLLKKIDQTLTKIENPTLKTTAAPATALPSALTFLDRVALIFQETLTLPENGIVKLTISVQPNGKIVIMELVQSESESNLQYLKLMLPLITLPPPEGGQEQTFTITFCND